MVNRLDKIKAARSLSDVADVVGLVAYELKNSSAIVHRLVASVSAELSIDANRTTPAPKSTKTNTPTATPTGGSTVKFEAPNEKELQKHVAVLNKLHDNVIELAAAEALIKQAFAWHKKAPLALKSIKSLLTDLDAMLDDAYAALHEIASKHLPEVMQNFADQVRSHLLDVLPTNSYSDIEPMLSVAPDPKGEGLFNFCYYIRIDNLTNKQGYKYRDYYFVLTGVISKSGKLQMFLNSLPGFKPPGRYLIGKPIGSVKEARSRVDMLLDHNNFVMDQEKQTLHLDTKRAQTSGLTSITGVLGVKVHDDELLLLIKPNASAALVKRITADTMARLASIVGVKANDQLFVSKDVTRGTQRILKFSVVPNLGQKHSFSVQKMREFAEHYGMNEQQEQAIRVALQQ